MKYRAEEDSSLRSEWHARPEQLASTFLPVQDKNLKDWKLSSTIFSGHRNRSVHRDVYWNLGRATTRILNWRATTRVRPYERWLRG